VAEEGSLKRALERVRPRSKLGATTLGVFLSFFSRFWWPPASQGRVWLLAYAEGGPRQWKPPRTSPPLAPFSGQVLERGFPVAVTSLSLHNTNGCFASLGLPSIPPGRVPPGTGRPCMFVRCRVRAMPRLSFFLPFWWPPARGESGCWPKPREVHGNGSRREHHHHWLPSRARGGVGVGRFGCRDISQPA